MDNYDYLKNDKFSLLIAGFTRHSRDADREWLNGNGKLLDKLEIKASDKSIFIDEMEINVCSGAVDEGKSPSVMVEIKEGINYAIITLYMQSPSDQFFALRDSPRQLEPLTAPIWLDFYIPDDDRWIKPNKSVFACKVTMILPGFHGHPTKRLF
jgi:hypothetical protein